MLGVLLLAVAVQAPAPSPDAVNASDPCAAAKWPGAQRVWGATHPRTLRPGKVLAKRMRVPLVILCETSAPYAAPAVMSKVMFGAESPYRIALVLIPREVADTFSNPAFRGILAHEYAHTLLPDEHPCSFRSAASAADRTFDEMEVCESAVDEYAARWVGYDAMIAELRASVNALLPFMTGDNGLLLKAEGELRIARLNKMKVSSE